MIDPGAMGRVWVSMCSAAGVRRGTRARLGTWLARNDLLYRRPGFGRKENKPGMAEELASTWAISDGSLAFSITVWSSLS